VRYFNNNYEDVRGLEIKVRRSVGRFVNGWFTYQRYATRTGQVGLEVIAEKAEDSRFYTPSVRTNQALATVQASLQLSSPSEWGPLAGDWVIGSVFTWNEGGEVIYRPDATVPVRDLPEENFLPVADSWKMDLKLTKSFRLPGSRSLSLYADVLNVFNTKSLNLAAISDVNDYYLYVVEQRRKGQDVHVGDASTFSVLTRPYRGESGQWKPPISARTEWLQHLYPRFFRFGVRFEV